jgi:Cu(I)/Ag(I) efflux system membrane protein CusA/SilA
MVIYLEEAVALKRAEGTLTLDRLHQAVIEGALLRLRPKVLTVATVVAGLLPLMWTARTGAEVMKPLATPVFGVMVSSPLHVLIVTPLIFTWLREREIRRQSEMPAHELDLSAHEPSSSGQEATPLFRAGSWAHRDLG